jgi:hypothetical protein
MRSAALTHPGTVIRLLTPTQDLVFARGDHGHAFGGGFRDLTVTKDGQGASQLAGRRGPTIALTDIPCNPTKGV